jgi:hypothetical protein
MRLLLAAVAVLAVSGCAPVEWTKDGAAPARETLKEDLEVCQQQGVREARYRATDLSGPGVADRLGIIAGREEERCMRLKGYERAQGRK